VENNYEVGKVMKKKLLVSMLIAFMSCGSLTYGAAVDNHWVMKELKDYKQYILPYRDYALLIDEETALQTAKKLDPDSEAEWKATFKRSLVLHYNKNRQIYDGWIVEAVYPAGNKMVVYMDARTGKIMVVSEIEAPMLLQ
jgi:uncharacterized membrane protein YkoI